MDFRSQLDAVRVSAGVANVDFRLVGLHQYEAILLKIIAHFTTLGRSGLNALWLWDSFQEPKFARADCPPMCTAMLRKLVPAEEAIWFVAEDSGRQKEHGNFWLYEGHIDAIAAVLDEAWLFEFYLVSKKFEWLLCENHHDVLIAVGEPMVGKLREMGMDSSRS